jgi:hypothetical protein
MLGTQSGYSTAGSGNILLGTQAGYNTSGSNNIVIGNAGAANEDGAIRIGTPGTHKAAYLAGVAGVTVSAGVTVVVDTNGKLGVLTSSRRYKSDITEMGDASDVLLGLQPVRFHYKSEIDPAATPQFGLIAEDVAKVDPDLIVRDNDGRPYTVRYEAVNAMLLNEFLKQHRKMDEQSALIAGQEKTMKDQQGAIDDQKATITKLQKQLESLSSHLSDLDARIQKMNNRTE